MKTIVLITAFALSLSSPRLIEVEPGLVLIVWENADANSAVVFNTSNAVCPYPTVQEGFGLGTVVTQAPEGPPYAEECTIRPGDQLYLQRYRDRQYVGVEGPFVVPYRAYLPITARYE